MLLVCRRRQHDACTPQAIKIQALHLARRSAIYACDAPIRAQSLTGNSSSTGWPHTLLGAMNPLYIRGRTVRMGCEHSALVCVCVVHQCIMKRVVCLCSRFISTLGSMCVRFGIGPVICLSDGFARNKFKRYAEKSPSKRTLVTHCAHRIQTIQTHMRNALCTYVHYSL